MNLFHNYISNLSLATALLLNTSLLMGKNSDYQPMVWQGQAFTTTEYFTLVFGKTISLKGNITGQAKGFPVDISYEIEVDKDWNILSVKIHKRSSPLKEIILRKDPANKWYDENGNYLKVLDQCTDIDLSLTPSTNSLPIKRLRFEAGSPYELKVAYIDLLSGEIRPLRQQYTLVKNNVYRYESLDSGFKADIETDEQGFVVNYPGVWERIYPDKSTHSNEKNFAIALISSSYSDELKGEDIMYDWLIGSWEVTVFDYLPDNTKIKTEGEWIVNWVLEGRAVQDVWIDPKRSLRSPAIPKGAPNRYGTSLRVFDPEEKKWKVYWNNPVSGVHNELTARREGKDIVQEGTDSNGNLMRWIFTDITEDSFHWYAELSSDQGKHWQLNAEFFGNRKK